MNLTILECKRFIASSGKAVLRRIDHYELDFYVGGKRETEIDGRKSIIDAGCICFRRPGQVACSVGDYDCYVSTIDFSGNCTHPFFGRQVQSVPQPVFRHELVDSIPDVFRVFHRNEILSKFMYISELPDCRCRSAALAMNEIFLLINADICREKLGHSGVDDSAAGKLIRYMNEHYRENVTLDILSGVANLDKSYLVRLFRSHCGMSPIEYLIDLRLGQARTLLINTDMPVGEIAFECGYNSTSFFVSSFRSRFGCTPGVYRKTH